MPDAGDAATDHPYGGFSSDVIELLRVAHSSTPLHRLLGLQFVNGPDPAVVTVEMPVAPAPSTDRETCTVARSRPWSTSLRVRPRHAPERSGPGRTRS